MKRFFLICLTLIALALPAGAEVSKLGAICLTGGGTGCLDSYNGSTLSDLDVAEVVSGGLFRIYQLDADSGLPEDSPNVIKPDAAAGLKRWILINTTVVAAHAATHVNGTDDIQDATTGQKGLMTSTYATKLDGIEALADVTDATNVNAAGATMNADTDVSGNAWVLDQDDLVADSNTKLATQQSIKAYVDNSIPQIHYVEPGTNTLSDAATAASDGDVLRLTTGTYTQTVAVSVTSKSLSILGAGPQVTRIACTGAHHGIDIDTNAAKKHVMLSGFTITTTNEATYHAIRLQGGDVASNSNRQFYIDNIIIKPLNGGASGDTGSWAIGIKLIEAWHTAINNVSIMGAFNTTDEMAYGIQMTEQSVSVRITNTDIHFTTYAIYGQDATEGVMITDCNLVYNLYGVYGISVGTGVNVSGSHISSFTTAIYLEDSNWTSINNNMIQRRADDTDNFIGIQIVNGNGHAIANNSIQKLGTGGTWTGIKVLCGFSTISGNMLINLTSDIVIDATSSRNNIVGNTGNGTTHITDNGTLNNVLELGGSGEFQLTSAAEQLYVYKSGVVRWRRSAGGSDMMLLGTTGNLDINGIYKGSGDGDAGSIQTRDSRAFSMYYKSSTNEMFFYEKGVGYKGFVALTAGSP